MTLGIKTYKALVYITKIIHVGIILCNILSVILMGIYQPWYFFFPFATIMFSPVVGESRCIVNRLENYFRSKAGMPLLVFAN